MGCDRESKGDIAVRMWRETRRIRTYQPYAADHNPMFFKKKVHQGATGRVYPIPFCDRLRDRPADVEHETLNLENEFIRLSVLPGIGGKVQSAIDKTNGYRFVYSNSVIKPALIGLAGPWVSGGIEFNWPQHHRPTTFMPVRFALVDNDDGSRTIWVGEIEPLYHMSGMAGITLYPGRSYIQVKVRLYNRTALAQPFMWWTNLAVHVNDEYRIVFPPDVTYMADHDRRAVISYPILKGVFQTARPYNYGSGVDGSWFPNIKVPTSLMVMHGQSDFDFLSGYDLRADAGTVHVANHHISPGKKLFTWGNYDFGNAWQRNLTDDDGPYVELMTGVYTDNQPDFSWIFPYDHREFEQYWYPIRRIGVVKNASIDAAVSLEVDTNSATVGFHVTAVQKGCTAVLRSGDRILMKRAVDLDPATPFLETTTLPADASPTNLRAELFSSESKLLVSYTTIPSSTRDAPLPRKPAEKPQNIHSVEELYLNGLHLEQYRHHSYDPQWYYREALKRDPGDSRTNTAMGRLALGRGSFADAEKYYRTAAERLTIRNPNPYDTEPFYGLGVALSYQGRYTEAYSYFYKAAWSNAWARPAYYALAEIDCRNSELARALEHLEKSLDGSEHHLRARNLKSVVLRRRSLLDEAEALAGETARIDALDCWSRFELALIARERKAESTAEAMLCSVRSLLKDTANTCLDLAIDYANARFYNEALAVLVDHLEHSERRRISPMVHYYIGYCYHQLGEPGEALTQYSHAEKLPADYCFPDRLESIAVLKDAQALNPEGARSFYYLGNLFYDKGQVESAVANWEESIRLDASFPTSHRNLALAYFDFLGNPMSAKEALEKAFALDPKDSRILYELLQLYKVTGEPRERSLELFRAHGSVVEERDDCYLEMCFLYAELGDYDTAIDLLRRRNFHIYEGGEGRLAQLHAWVHVRRGLERLDKANVVEALEDFKQAFVLPENYGEGKSYGAQEAHIHYFLGLAYNRNGDHDKARASYEKAACEGGPPSEVSYFQGIALRSLGRNQEAARRFKDLMDAGDAELARGGDYDYFGVGMRNPAPFQGNITRWRKVESTFLKALGLLGLGEKDRGTMELQKVLDEDPRHFHASFFLHLSTVYDSSSGELREG